MKIITFILAGICLFFGVLFIWGAFDNPFDGGSLIIGIITLAVGIIFLSVALKNNKKAENVYKIDLPGEMKVNTQNCRQCGAPLNANDFKMVNGTPTVTCHYCGSVYEVTEEPKW